MPASSPPASRAPTAPTTACCASTYHGHAPDSGFTLLFEQVALLLMREMPVSAAARIIGVTDQRLWRILQFYVRQAIERLDLRHVEAIALDETAARRGQEYVTVFI